MVVAHTSCRPYMSPSPGQALEPRDDSALRDEGAPRPLPAPPQVRSRARQPNRAPGPRGPWGRGWWPRQRRRRQRRRRRRRAGALGAFHGGAASGRGGGQARGLGGQEPLVLRGLPGRRVRRARVGSGGCRGGCRGQGNRAWAARVGELKRYARLRLSACSMLCRLGRMTKGWA